MGGGSKTETKHETQSNTIDPMQMAQYQQNYSRAQDTVGALKPYTGQITAGFNPTQIQSQGILSSIAQDPRYQNTNSDIIGGVKSLMANPITPQTYDAAQFAGTDLTPYINPYTDQVVNTTLADLQHARDQQGVADAQSATRAGSFQGAGTRFGVQNANTTNDYLRNVSGTSAALRSGAYSNAQAAAFQDIGARNAASQFNIGNRLSADQFNKNFGLQGAQALSGLNDQGLNLATKQAGILAAVGDTQQAQAQKELTDAYNAYLTGQQLTLSQQQALNQALGIIPIQQTQTSDGTNTTKTSGGLSGVLGGVASLGLGLASLPTSTLGGGILSKAFG